MNLAPNEYVAFVRKLIEMVLIYYVSNIWAYLQKSCFCTRGFERNSWVL